MNFSKFFIMRPIFATVISLLITFVGTITYFSLPVAQYPEIAPPTISVRASYPGASAETISKTVATPIEQQINGVENMLYMLSQSTSDGQLQITITFELGTDLDEAQVLVQNRIAQAEPRLPEIVRALGLTVQQNSPDFLMVVHFTSPNKSLSSLYISNYVSSQILDQLSRVEGVGQARIFGERSYAMRIWLDPNRMAVRNLTAAEVVSALRNNNVQVASGTINEQPVPKLGAFRLNVQTQGRLDDPDSFADVVVRTEESGEQIRVRDIGRVELAAESYGIKSFLNAEEAVAIGVFQRPGSNALDTADRVKTLMDNVSNSFPPDLEYQIIYNPTEFVEESVNAVYYTIAEAVVLVILVIVIFLQSLRAAIIPIVAIPISLTGTFFLMSLFGFSLNSLSLFGLVLAIGIVVDDAIVVVENIERNIERGLQPTEAAIASMREVSGALIATSLVLLAVFIPSTFITGITGQFFLQFALTIAASTAISTIVSLTLSPAMGALFLKSRDDREREPQGFAKAMSVLTWPLRKGADAFNWAFGKLEGIYAVTTRGLIRVSVIVLVVYGGLVALTGQQFAAAPSGFIPSQDQGYLITVVQLPAGASLDRTEKAALKIGERLRAIDGIDHTVTIAGLDGATFTGASNSAVSFAVLSPFEERIAKGQTAGMLLGQSYGAIQDVMEARAFIIAPPPVRGVGNAGGWKLYVQDARGRGLDVLEDAVAQVVDAASRRPELTQVRTTFDTRTPSIFAEIDRVKAQQIGVSLDDLFNTMEVYLGSAFVNDFNLLSRTYRVTAQADGIYRDTPSDILRIMARSQSGEMVPLGSVVQLKDQTSAYRVPRYNLFSAAAVQGASAPGYSTGDALEAMEEVLEANLPPGFSFEWTELALQEKNAGNTAIYAFAAAVLLVFLVLAALYESWMLPMAIILIVPMCLLSSVVGVVFAGLDVNILVQVGFVVLIGLAAKNAILIVEFAKQAEEDGATAADAAAEAAKLRLRPILMTSIAFILAVVPLMIAEGPGAEMRQSLGTAVFWGMLGVSIFGLLFTPVFYVVCRWIGDRTLSLLGRENGKSGNQSASEPAE